ncbi:hypothetical protein KQX54_013108 [Cotesia glomerata]|uniref:Uncharacterized protein n=1 Tax=Cotesia glomerata TaxID=32391 RepID=A0AAV7HR79_COTGL|nr:hypothetical protein KQX54_013108 [Cotesia glomerata]
MNRYVKKIDVNILYTIEAINNPNVRSRRPIANKSSLELSSDNDDESMDLTKQVKRKRKVKTQNTMQSKKRTSEGILNAYYKLRDDEDQAKKDIEINHSREVIPDSDDENKNSENEGRSNIDNKKGRVNEGDVPTEDEEFDGRVVENKVDEESEEEEEIVDKLSNGNEVLLRDNSDSLFENSDGEEDSPGNQGDFGDQTYIRNNATSEVQPRGINQCVRLNLLESDVFDQLFEQNQPSPNKIQRMQDQRRQLEEERRQEELKQEEERRQQQLNQGDNEDQDDEENLDITDPVHIGGQIYIPSYSYNEAFRTYKPSKFITLMSHAIWGSKALARRAIKISSTNQHKLPLTPKKLVVLENQYKKFLKERNLSKDMIAVERAAINTYLGRSISSAEKKVAQQNENRNDHVST